MITRGPSFHLGWAELACKDAPRSPYPGTWQDRALALAGAFEVIRAVIGGPLKVASAFRTLEHNRAVGGAADSQHIHGRALDLIVPLGWGIERFVKSIEDLARAQGIIRGIGVYHDGHVHVDIRPTDELVLWRASRLLSIGNAC